MFGLDNTKMMGLVGAFIVVMVLVVVFIVSRKESLTGSGTRIFRTGSALDISDAGDVPPGVITGVPVFDYRHTWFDGTAHRSCDECPGSLWCPTCPNVQTTNASKPELPKALWGEKFSTGDLGIVGMNALSFPGPVAARGGFGVAGLIPDGISANIGQGTYSPVSISAAFTPEPEKFDWHGIHPVNAEFIPDPLMMTTISRAGTTYPLAGPYHGERIGEGGHIDDVSSYLTSGFNPQPSVDYSSGIPDYMQMDLQDSAMVYEDGDQEFWAGRGPRGACGGKTGYRGRRNPDSKYESVAYLGTRNDDQFDGERALLLGTSRCHSSSPSTSIKSMQTNNSNIVLRLAEPRTFLGAQGYVYKENGTA